MLDHSRMLDCVIDRYGRSQTPRSECAKEGISMTATETESPPPTARQLEILRWVAGFISDKGFPPTRRDICRGFEFASPNAAQIYMTQLKRRGLVTYTERASRTLRLTPAGMELIGGGA
jgi:SOS-response transcriptional repressor LexA